MKDLTTKNHGILVWYNVLLYNYCDYNINTLLYITREAHNIKNLITLGLTYSLLLSQVFQITAKERMQQKSRPTKT